MIQPASQFTEPAVVETVRGVLSSLARPGPPPSLAPSVKPDGLPEPPHPQLSGWERILYKLAQFRELGDDWDGQGACPPSSELLDFAGNFVLAARQGGLDAPGTVTPGPAGTVLFVWHDADGTYFDLEIERPGHAELMLIEPGKPARHWTVPDDE